MIGFIEIASKIAKMASFLLGVSDYFIGNHFISEKRWYISETDPFISENVGLSAKLDHLSAKHILSPVFLKNIGEKSTISFNISYLFKRLQLYPRKPSRTMDDCLPKWIWDHKLLLFRFIDLRYNFILSAFCDFLNPVWVDNDFTS
jgi:hypothetical protein